MLKMPRFQCCFKPYNTSNVDGEAQKEKCSISFAIDRNQKSCKSILTDRSALLEMTPVKFPISSTTKYVNAVVADHSKTEDTLDDISKIIQDVALHPDIVDFLKVRLPGSSDVLDHLHKVSIANEYDKKLHAWSLSNSAGVQHEQKIPACELGNVSSNLVTDKSKTRATLATSQHTRQHCSTATTKINNNTSSMLSFSKLGNNKSKFNVANDLKMQEFIENLQQFPSDTPVEMKDNCKSNFSNKSKTVKSLSTSQRAQMPCKFNSTKNNALVQQIMCNVNLGKNRFNIAKEYDKKMTAAMIKSGSFQCGKKEASLPLHRMKTNIKTVIGSPVVQPLYNFNVDNNAMPFLAGKPSFSSVEEIPYKIKKMSKIPTNRRFVTVRTKPKNRDSSMLLSSYSYRKPNERDNSNEVGKGKLNNKTSAYFTTNTSNKPAPKRVAFRDEMSKTLMYGFHLPLSFYYGVEEGFNGNANNTG